MGAQQGQRYRVLSPKQSWERAHPGQNYRAPRIAGQGTPADRYISKIQNNDGEITVLDIYGDVISASENVAYPRGTNADYRNVRWIDEHAERFELIENN